MKRLLIGCALLLLAVAAAGGGYWLKHRGNVHTVHGSPTVEFEPKQSPRKVAQRPKAVVRAVPWPSYGYDLGRTHVAPSFADKLRPPFRRLWSVRTGYYIEFPPAVAYGRVYVAQLRGRFLAVDAQTGKVRWQKRFHNCTAASPAVGDGVVYQPYLPLPCDHGSRTARGFVVAMNARTGRILWRFPGPSSESSPLLIGKTLYFGAWDHRLYALDVRTRKVRWTFKASGELNSAPAYANGTIYIGSDDGRLYAVSARTGRLRWRASSFSHFPSGREYFYATPAIAYGRVFIGYTDGIVYAFGATTGHLLWAQRAGTYVYTAAAVYRKTVYVGSYDGNVYAFDAATGDLRWRHSSPGSIHGAPTVLGGLVYFSTCGTCGSHGSRYAKRGPRTTFALDARTGKLVWTFPDGRYSPIVTDGQRVYLTGDTRVYGLVPCSRRPPPPTAPVRRVRC